MNKHLKPSLYLLIYLVLGGLFIFNLYNYQSLILGMAVGILYLLFYGYIFGSLLFTKNTFPFRIFFGLFSLISLFSLLGAVVYYIFNLNLAIIATLVLLIPLVFFLLLFRKNSWQNLDFQLGEKGEKKKNHPFIPFLILIFLALTVLGFYLLWQAQTSDTLRTPWQTVNSLFFIVYLLNTAVLLTLVLTNKKHYLSLPFIFIHTFLALSVALFVYQLGYGFDSFIHQATEKTIAAFGQISPKPFYYIGQYSLVVILSKLLFLPVEMIDKFLVPALASLFLPATVYIALSRGFNWDKRYSLVLSLLILALPFHHFIVTTPQGLANVYFLIIIFLSLLYITRPAKLSVILYLTFLSLTALLIHPLTGIPLLIFMALLFFYSYINKSESIVKVVRKSLFWEIFIIAAIALPLVFIINSSLTSSGLNTTFNTEVFSQPTKIIETLNFKLPVFQKLFFPIYDFIYSYQFYLSYIIIALAIIGLIVATKKHQIKSFSVYLATFLALIINVFLLKVFILFPSLIYYEQGDYPQRVWQLSLYFLLPFLFYIVYQLIKTAQEKKIYSLRIGLIFFLTIFLGSSLYLSYPRHDYYQVGHGYSVSDSDIKTVNYIEQDAKNQDYVVLANQTVAAAAIRELGFKKYYQTKDNEHIFFYPIPTGGQLYQIFLEMVYEEPFRETAQKAQELTGAKAVYFVLNNYWYKFTDIAEMAMETANKWAVIDGGKTYIFRYDFR